MIAKKIFYQLSQYARQHIHGTFQYATKKNQDANGQVYYEVELCQNSTVHHLRFNEEGDLVGKEVMATFPEEIEI